jgi:hypothetical protein
MPFDPKIQVKMEENTPITKAELAIALLRSWRDGDEQEQQETLAHLQEALKRESLDMAERHKLCQDMCMDPEIIRRAQSAFMAQLSPEDRAANEWAITQERNLKMTEDPREMEAMDDEMEPTAEARGSKKNRNVEIIERTLSLAVRAEDLAGEVTHNSVIEAGAREKIDAFKAHMKAGAEMGKELLTLFKA